MLRLEKIGLKYKEKVGKNAKVALEDFQASLTHELLNKKGWNWTFYIYTLLFRYLRENLAVISSPLKKRHSKKKEIWEEMSGSLS